MEHAKPKMQHIETLYNIRVGNRMELTKFSQKASVMQKNDYFNFLCDLISVIKIRINLDTKLEYL